MTYPSFEPPRQSKETRHDDIGDRQHWTIGGQVLRFLDGQYGEIRSLTRSPEKAAFPSGVTAVKGDLSDIDSVRAALDGVRTLFLLA